MSRVRTVCLVWVVGVSAVSIDARGADKTQLSKLKTALTPKKSVSPHLRTSECVQKLHAIILGDGNKKIAPSGAGFIYLVEQNEANRLLVCDLNEGVRGWASPAEMVPLNQAEVYFSGQIKSNARNAFAHLMRGVARLENDDLDGASADLDEALTIDPKYVPALVARAQLWQWRHRLDRAVEDAGKAIELDGRISYAFVERGVFEYNLKHYDKALKDFDKADELGSKAAISHIARGMMLIEKGKLPKAQQEFNEAIKLDPKHPDAYSGYALLFLTRGDSKTAITMLDQAIDADPQNPESHGNRAIVFESIGKYDKALDDLDEVIRFAPNSARALRERAWLLTTCSDAKLRKPEEALKSATRACELFDWNEPKSLMTLAAACSETGDFAGAVKWQQKALDLVVKSRKPLYQKDVGNHNHSIVTITPPHPDEAEYERLLDRYKASKPYLRRGILEELGLKQVAATSKS
jgi:tetratricopeptide (TPR) repeat protein